VHAGRVIERARRVDLYANCFVKRHRPSGRLEIDEVVDLQQTDSPAPVRTSPLTMTSLAREDADADADDGDDNDIGNDRGERDADRDAGRDAGRDDRPDDNTTGVR